jgi:hypothetical protein
MKKLIFLFCLILISGVAFSQKKAKKHKLTKDEMANMTPDQRFVYESERKAGKKSRISNKQKVKVQRSQSRKSERIRQPKRRKSRSQHG